MDIRHPAGHRIVDRDHGELGAAGAHRGEGVLEGRARQRLVVRDRPRCRRCANSRPARPGTRSSCALLIVLALGHAGLRLCHDCPVSMARAFSKSSGVSTPSGTASTMRDVDAHAGLERAQLLELLAPLQRRRRQRDEALERRAAIGIKADVMIERPLAGGRRGAGEIERAQPRRRDRRADHLDHIGIGALGRDFDLGRQRGDVDGGVGERPQRRRDDRPARASAGRLAVDDDLGAAAPDRPCRAPRRCGRSRRHDRRASSPRGRRLYPQRRRRPAESVATTTGPSSASCARRRTCTIIGSPAISASGLPGQPGRGHAGGNEDQDISHRCAAKRLIRVARRAANRLFVHRPPLFPLRSLSAMNSFEINKILGALLGTCLVLVAMHIASGAIFTPRGAGKARLRDRGEGGGAARAARRRRRRRKCRSRPAAPAPRSRRAPRPPSNASSATTSRKARAPRSAPIFTASSGAPVASEPGFNYSAPLKAKGGTWTFDALNKWLTKPQRRRSGHGDDLRRPVERETARRRHRLPQHPFGTSRCRCRRRRRAARQPPPAPANAGAAPAAPQQQLTAAPCRARRRSMSVAVRPS